MLLSVNICMHAWRHLYKASWIIVFKLTIFYYYFVFRNRHADSYTFKKIANCVHYKIKLKQSNFERSAKTILGFETEKLPLINLPIM